MTTYHDNICIEALQGDIADQRDIQAVVNAANAELQYGGGVAGALHSAAGAGLAQECRPLAPIRPGEAVITGAHDLPNNYVIHCLGPIYGHDRPEDELLASCYREALKLAEESDVVSIAFPAISTGAFGYPFKEATDVALTTVRNTLSGLETVTHIRFVLYSDHNLAIYKNKLQGFFND